MKYSRYDLNFPQGISVLHRFKTKKSNQVIFLLHGYFEDGKIFYSQSGKGFAPFLAENGFDVFVCDLLGKGSSRPLTKNGLTHSQYDIITNDIPGYLSKVRSITGINEIHLGGHSWGGVLLMAYLSRFKDEHIKSLVTFGSKRRIGRKNLRKLLYIDLMWNTYGQFLVKKYGYLPARKLKLGNQDEPKHYFLQTNNWVYSKNWISEVDGFDYRQNLQWNTPPSLFITGKGDKILGHPKDVNALMQEMQAENCEYHVIGKSTNYKHNYNHINLLTHPDAPQDHFSLVINFLRRC